MRNKHFIKIADGSSRSLQRRLIQTMLLLFVILASLVISGLFLFRQVSIPGQATSKELYLQEEFFVESEENYWNNLGVMAIDFSSDASTVIENILNENHLSSESLNSTNAESTTVEGVLLPLMMQRLLQVQCSGGFIIFKNEDGKETVHGIYLNKDIHHISNPEIIMYRGAASVAENNDLILHSKWHMEMNVDSFPEYQLLIVSAETADMEQEVYLSEMITLAGTDEKVVLLICPLKSSTGEVYGLCGFEVSERYFRYANEQPTRMSRLICMMTPGEDAVLDADKALHCGYHYVKPTGILNSGKIGNNLLSFTSDNSNADQAYVGLQEKVSADFVNGDLVLTVMIPKEDYDRAVRSSIYQAVILIALIVFSTIVCVWYFSRRYLSPIRKSLQYMKEKNYVDAKVDIDELDDLSEFMQEQSNIHQEKLNSLAKDKQNAEAEAARLAYDRKKEIDPAIYEHFKKGLKELTAAERQILNMFADGMKAADILSELSITENTLKYHSKNIYSKLGIHSRRQVAMYMNVYRKERQKIMNDKMEI